VGAVAEAVQQDEDDRKHARRLWDGRAAVHATAAR
jgi:hypothetical protein